MALSEMCISGNKGININKPQSLINYFEYFFSEDQGRYIIEIEKNNFDKVKEILSKSSVHYDELGIITKKDIKLMIPSDLNKISITQVANQVSGVSTWGNFGMSLSRRCKPADSQ